jgi:glycosyltransferase involved in cell wall biosynthesis
VGPNERLRIAMVSTPFVSVPPARYGGTELVVSELVNGLALRGHDVVLFATGDSRAPCTVRSLFPTPVWPPEPLHEQAHAAWAAQAIRESARPFDVVHAHVSSFLPWARLLGDTPVVYTLHHDRDETMSRFYRSVSAQVEYVAISARQAGLHRELERLWVVHHGLNPDAYPFGAEGQGYLAFLGRYSEVKGPDVAIEVARRLGRELRMAGRTHEVDGDFGERVLAPLLRAPHVRDLGELGHAAKVKLLAGADALLFPIRWEEPFGLVMIEAMLCGAPVVAFAGGSVSEVIEPGLTGFIARDLDDMVGIVRDRVPLLDRRRVRERAVQRFSNLRMVDDYVALFHRAIARRQGTRDMAETEVAGR